VSIVLLVDPGGCTAALAALRRIAQPHARPPHAPQAPASRGRVCGHRGSAAAAPLRCGQDAAAGWVGIARPPSWRPARGAAAAPWGCGAPRSRLSCPSSWAPRCQDVRRACWQAGAPPRGAAANAHPPPPARSAPAVQDGALGVLPAYKGPVDAVRQIMRQEGWRAFYSGAWACSWPPALAGVCTFPPWPGPPAVRLAPPCLSRGGAAQGALGPGLAARGPGRLASAPAAEEGRCPVPAPDCAGAPPACRPGARRGRQRLRLGHLLLLLRGHQRQAHGAAACLRRARARHPGGRTTRAGAPRARCGWCRPGALDAALLARQPAHSTCQQLAVCRPPQASTSSGRTRSGCPRAGTC
jgi:hypothetical protein